MTVGTATRRARRALLASLLALVASVGLAGPAGAVVVPVGECIANERDAFEEAIAGVDPDSPEYLALVEEWEGRYEACMQAPHPLLPKLPELIWGSVAFLVVLGFVWRFGYPAIQQGMDARAERIRADLDAADSQRNEAETLLSEYRAQLADARQESGRIIEEARQQADALKREQEARLREELEEMRQRATADIEVAKAQAVADLRSEVADLAVRAAEVVVQRSLDRESQLELIETYINQVAATDGR